MHLKLASILSENTAPFVRELAAYLSRATGFHVTPVEDVPWQERERMLDRGDADLGFFCGLYYVRKAGRPECPVELLGAPVMRGRRYAGKPVYYSDVIVRRDSPYRTFRDLRGASWSFNEPNSHSGYNVVRGRLARAGETAGYFGRVVEAGSHLQSLRLVLEGDVCASALDSTVLELELRSRPELARRLRKIATLGPSTIPPAVVRRDLPLEARHRLRSALLEMHQDARGRESLERGWVERFVPVRDSDYDDIRRTAREAEGIVLGARGVPPAGTAARPGSGCGQASIPSISSP